MKLTKNVTSSGGCGPTFFNKDYRNIEISHTASCQKAWRLCIIAKDALSRTFQEHLVHVIPILQTKAHLADDNRV